MVAFDAPYAWLAGWRNLGMPRDKPGLRRGVRRFRLCGRPSIDFGLAPFRSCCPLPSGFCWWVQWQLDYTRSAGRARRTGCFSRHCPCGIDRKSFAAFGMLLFLLYFFSMMLAFLLFMLFSASSFPPLDQLVPALLLTAPGQGLLTGTVVSIIFATVLASSISVNVGDSAVFNREVDAVTAMMASIRAVRTNLQAMALWAVLVAALGRRGWRCCSWGLGSRFPLAGYASWRACRGTGRDYARAASTFGLASAWRTA